MSDQLQHRMNAYTVQPPAASWEKIAVRLDDDDRFEALSTRMQQVAIPPPLESFDNIFQKIDVQPGVQTVISRKRPVYRVAAAAIIAAVLVVAWMVFNTGAAVTRL